MYYHLGSSTSEYKVCSGENNPSWRLLTISIIPTLAHPIIVRKVRPVRTHGQSTVHPQARIHMAVPNPAAYQRVNSTTTLPTKQIPPPNNCSSP